MCARGGRNSLFYYSNTLEVTREDQMKEKKTTLGIPTHRVSRRDPGKLKVDRLRSCIIKSIISITIIILGFLGMSPDDFAMAMMVS